MIQSKNLIEEYMLLTNIIVAEFVKPFCLDKTLLRAHQDIPADKKVALNQFFEIIGYGDRIDLTNSTTLSHSLEALNQEEDKGPFNVALLKFFGSLQAAQYVTIGGNEVINELRGKSQAISHYGLNFPLYTHFTSPIRRYADLLVHRQVTAVIEHGEEAKQAIAGTDYQ
jgi:exoribonuclease R